MATSDTKNVLDSREPVQFLASTGTIETFVKQVSVDLVVKITQALGILNQQNYMLSVACLFHLVFVRTDTDGLSEREDDGCAWDSAPGPLV